MFSALRPAPRRCVSARILAVPGVRLLALLAASFATPLAGQMVITIPVENPSFETPTPSTFPDYTLGATGWTRTRSDTDAGTFAPGTTVTPAPVDGSQVGFANGFGGLQQVLGTTLDSGFAYTFSVWLGYRSDELNSPTGSGSIALGIFDGNQFTPLASAATTVGLGNFQLVTGTYQVTDATAGQMIALQIVSTGNFQIVFDAVAVTASSIPEPSAFAAVLALGALAFAHARRRSRRICPAD